MHKTLPVWALVILLTCSSTVSAQGKKKKDNFEQMDYGPFLSASFIVPPKQAKEFVYRGVVVPFELPDKTKAAASFSTPRVAALFVRLDGWVYQV